MSKPEEQSELLTKFYNEYASWMHDGGVTIAFAKDKGLCGNLFAWGVKYTNYRTADTLLHEMHNQFIDAGLDPDFPFNHGSFRYAEEIYANRVLDNPKRIQWVQEHCTNG